jgi:Raf kinase inhibitor-like YbhB/YbcL family protein
LRTRTQLSLARIDILVFLKSWILHNSQQNALQSKCGTNFFQTRSHQTVFQLGGIMQHLVPAARQIHCAYSHSLKAQFGAAVGLIVILAALSSCRGSAPNVAGKPRLNLTSSSIRGGEMPKQSTCDGTSASPELAWSAPPAGTQSLALVAFDKDSPFGYSFTHWVLYDLPADKRELPEGLPKQEQLPDGSRQGPNDFDKTGYVGPCPPGKSAHHYNFTLYALDSKLNLPAGANRKQVEQALDGHVVAYGALIGSYQH